MRQNTKLEDFVKPQSNRACALAVLEKIDNGGEVAEVAARFNNGRSKVDRSLHKICRRQ